MWSSISEISTGRRTWKFTEHTSVRIFDLCGTISSTQTQEMYFAASEIPLVGCIEGKHGVRPNPQKIKMIAYCLGPVNVKVHRNFIWVSGILLQVIAQQRRDDRAYISFNHEKCELVIKR